MMKFFRFYFLSGLLSDRQTFSICAALFLVMLSTVAAVSSGLLSSQSLAVASVWCLTPALLFRLYVVLVPYYREAALKTWG
ncbi:hypothetical protein [uncultured Vibrio sp.]|uniref:hypothetical protein n=1 Tax=uncultured Vibrio sp. TaxID=114054 RepID=UPI0025CCA8C1|nr:hypothetical protein [uncultured Vibrio sp.]